MEYYFNQGIKFLINYFLANQPFKDNTIATEKRILINLDPLGKHKLRGCIDRLAHNKENNVFEIDVSDASIEEISSEIIKILTNRFKHMKKYKIIAAILTCFGLCTITAFAETQTGTKSRQPSAVKLIEPGKLKEDLDFILKNIDEIHPNMYAYISKEEFNTLKIETYEKLNKPLNDLEYYIAIAPLVAEIRNGHTRIRPNKEVLLLLQSEMTKAHPIEIDCHSGSVFIKGYYGLLDFPIGEIL